MAGIEIAKKSDLEGFVDGDYVDGKLAEVDTDISALTDLVGQKADDSHTHSYNDLTNTPSIPDVSGLATATSVDDLAGKVADKANSGDVYPKSEVDDLISGLQAQIDELKTDNPDPEE
ncbi:hypothetical protein JOC34_000460 [Virgibacillus halotolerans]|uniref:hypothetical protein n=1 Tax=Virgibacillus halotolerans TaxID=1071053 RepID=UPI0019614829|nr:hypothetical protein [Virgibacillus halotolerans]MBM7598103.1 hypothetical protein [Virgibacillus halotolerans]